MAAVPARPCSTATITAVVQKGVLAAAAYRCNIIAANAGGLKKAAVAGHPPPRAILEMDGLKNVTCCITNAIGRLCLEKDDSVRTDMFLFGVPAEASMAMRWQPEISRLTIRDKDGTPCCRMVTACWSFERPDGMLQQMFVGFGVEQYHWLQSQSIIRSGIPGPFELKLTAGCYG